MLITKNKFFLIIFLLFFILNYSQALEIGYTAPSISDNRTKQDEVTVVAIWATWCKPCKELIPFLNLLNAQKNVEVIGVALEKGDSIEERQSCLDNFMKNEINRTYIPEYSIVLDKFDGGALEQIFLVESGWFGIPVVFVISSDGRLAEIMSISLSDKENFLKKIEIILNKRWDFKQAQEAFEPLKKQGQSEWATYQRSKKVRQQLSLKEPQVAYLFLVQELNEDPNLKNFFFYDPLFLAIQTNNVNAAQMHFYEIFDFVKKIDYLLEYLLTTFKKIVTPNSNSKILELQIHVAKHLHVNSEGTNLDANKTLFNYGFKSVCIGDICIPVSSSSNNQCTTFLSD